MHFTFLTGTPLFLGATAEEAGAMLGCLGAYEKRYAKGETIFGVGTCVDSMGLVLSGGVNIEVDDLWGNRTLFGHVEPGQIFAETYACIPHEPLMVNVTACERSDVLFLNAARLMTTCPNSCAHHAVLIRNLLMISARKNLGLSRRILHTSPKSIRARLLSYLSEQAKHNGKREFSIPFNRQQLADYLNVDRSALSGELSRMQSEGVLTYRKNYFALRKE